MTKDYTIYVVEHAVDSLIKQEGSKYLSRTGVPALELADVATVERWEMSWHLQEYRRIDQSRRRYVLVCEGYGTGARWKVLSKPGTDLASTQRARADHLTWIAHDGARKLGRDLVREMYPSLRGTATDQVLQDEAQFIEDTLGTILRRVDRKLKQAKAAMAGSAA